MFRLVGEGRRRQKLREGASAAGCLEGDLHGARAYLERSLEGYDQRVVLDARQRRGAAADRDLLRADERVRPRKRRGNADDVGGVGEVFGDEALVVGRRERPEYGRLRRTDRCRDLERVQASGDAAPQGYLDFVRERRLVVGGVVWLRLVAVDRAHPADGVPCAGRIAFEALLHIAGTEVAEALEHDELLARVCPGRRKPRRHRRPDLRRAVGRWRRLRGEAGEAAAVAAFALAADDMRIAVGHGFVGKREL